MHIGLIGLGLLGSAMAERWLSTGHFVLGFDIDPACRERLQAAGGHVADSAAAVFAGCGDVVLSLPDNCAVRQVLETVPSQLLEHVPPPANRQGCGRLIIDTTTGDPQAAAETGAALARRGIAYVDATVAGSSAEARLGQVVVMAGGTVEAFGHAVPVLASFSTRQFHTGPCGSGATAKLIVNLVLGLNRAVLAEGLHLAQQCGVDLEQMLEILQSGPAYSRVMDTKGRKMVSRDFTPQARLQQHWKDVRLIRELGRRHAARLPLSELHDRLLQRAAELGYGPLDNSAILRVWDADSLSPDRPPDHPRLDAPN